MGYGFYSEGIVIRAEIEIAPQVFDYYGFILQRLKFAQMFWKYKQNEYNSAFGKGPFQFREECPRLTEEIFFTTPCPDCC